MRRLRLILPTTAIVCAATCGSGGDAVALGAGRQVVIYDNTANPLFHWSPWDFPGQYSFPYEHGDHLLLAGSERSVTQIDILYSNPLSNDVTTDITVRLYDGDPTYGAPLLWSTIVDDYLFPARRSLTLTVFPPGIALSFDECAVTYEFTDIQGDPVGAGLRSFYPPVVGASEGWFPAYVDGIWEHYTYEGQPEHANFAMRVYALPGPLPGDCDSDDDVDLDDLAGFIACFAGPLLPPFGGCDCPEPDDDGDFDLIDFALLQTNFAGPLSAVARQ